MTPPAIRYPAGPVTPQGAYHVLKGNLPQLTYRAPDNSAVFHMLGGQAAPFHDRTMPESIGVKSLKGLIPPWQTVDQKGATEDGVTNIDSLYDPMEIDAELILRGRNAKLTRKLVRDWIASNDAKQTGTLSWFSHDLGYWWSDVRWFKTPTDPLLGGQRKRQDFNWVWRADNGFWKSFEDIDVFTIPHELTRDNFNRNDADDLGTGWDLAYSGDGSSFIHTVYSTSTYPPGYGQATFADDPADPTVTGRDVVARRASFTTDADNQIISIVLGVFPVGSFSPTGAIDLWGRLATSGTPGANGIRLRIRQQSMRLSRFVSGSETVLREWAISIPPLPGEGFQLICGYATNSRLFKVIRNNAEIQTVIEGGGGTLSHIGSGYRGLGFGMHTGPTAQTNHAPPSILSIAAADNQDNNNGSGYLRRVNVGDQPRFERYTCFGPGTFTISDGPSNTSYVQFGPLLPGQVMQLRTDPRKYGVVDLTSTPSTPQEQNLFAQAINDFISFATSGNVGTLLHAIQSLFGVQPPQGNPYMLLHGRFSQPIPAKSPGYPASPYHVACSITGGNADSKIVATGTPLRRYPL